MLNIKFRNISITTENHEDLLRDDVKEVLAALKDIFDNAEILFRKNPKSELCYSVTRLTRNDKLIVAYDPLAQNNPYIFLLDKNGKILIDSIPLEKLLVLKNDTVKDILKENVLHVSDVRFKCIQTEELSNQVKRLSKSL